MPLGNSLIAKAFDSTISEITVYIYKIFMCQDFIRQYFIILNMKIMGNLQKYLKGKLN